MGMRRAPIAVLYLAAVAGGTYGAFRPTFASGFALVQTDPGDTVLNHYVLEHTWQAVSNPGYRGTVWSPPFFYPTPLVLAYSENLLGAAPVYWLLRLGLPDVLAFQVWMIVLNALNFVAFAAVARWLGCGHGPAVFGGFLWAFALVHVEQIRHQQLIPRFWMPVAVYHAWRLAAGPNLRSLNRLAGCVVLQTVTGIYAGWFLAFGLVAFLPLAAAARPGGVRDLLRFARERGWAALGVGGLWAAALLAFLTPYFLAHGTAGWDYEKECAMRLPLPAGWLAGPPGSRWYDTIRPHRAGIRFEGLLFCGFGLYALAAAAAAHAWATRRDPGRSRELAFAGAALAAAAVLVVVTLNLSDGTSGWSVARFIPGGKAIRCVARVYLAVYLLADLAVVLWLKVLLDRVRNRWVRAAVFAALAGPVVFEQTGFEPEAFPAAAVYPAADALAEAFRGADAGYLVPRSGPDRVYDEVIAMWAGLRANVPVVNGYSSRYPPGYPIDIHDDIDESLRGWLRGRFRGRVAVVDPAHPGRVRYVVVE